MSKQTEPLERLRRDIERAEELSQWRYPGMNSEERYRLNVRRTERNHAFFSGMIATALIATVLGILFGGWAG